MNRALETYSGRYFDYTAPSAADVCLEDVAHALSHVCRFGGHSRVFYSVAEHALLCAGLLGNMDPAWQLAALHHDSHEAYLGDVPRPLKVGLGDGFDALAHQTDLALSLALGLDARLFKNPIVKWADDRALAIEAGALTRSGGRSEYWSAWRLPDGEEAPDWWVPGRPPQDVAFDFAELHRTLGGRQA